jgi:hypothetical protein
MSFGQAGGPPASARQIAYLLTLVQAIGHDDFRSARHPLGLTQRQAGGKFTTGEAIELIDKLVNGEPVPEDAPPPRVIPAAQRAPRARPSTKSVAVATGPATELQASVVAGMPAELLADELTRRGWAVIAPTV